MLQPGARENRGTVCAYEFLPGQLVFRDDLVSLAGGGDGVDLLLGSTQIHFTVAVFIFSNHPG